MRALWLKGVVNCECFVGHFNGVNLSFKILQKFQRFFFKNLLLDLRNITNCTFGNIWLIEGGGGGGCTGNLAAWS